MSTGAIALLGQEIRRRFNIEEEEEDWFPKVRKGFGREEAPRAATRRMRIALNASVRAG
jgi:hypothetical protein